jgi:protoporphyrinogen oxidase
MSLSHKTQVTVVGAGFSGLSIAYELAKKGIAVTVLEAESNIGGLAAAFEVGGVKLDRFYHHWFTNDLDVMRLIDELGMNDHIEINPTNTGMYYANNFFKLSTPMDLLNFTPLPFFDRIRLGLLALRARRVKDWKSLEGKMAHEWLRELGGEKVYRVVWQPLLRGKFGSYADQISAVWFWNKLKLRGGSRGKGGEERLAYFRGGFVCLAEALASRIRRLGGRIELDAPVSKVEPDHGVWKATTPRGVISSNRIVITTALPPAADMIRGWAGNDYIRSLEQIQYIGNICLILELDRSLSNLYWLNVNDPNFPFVGVIEHTNFQRPENYAGKHIVYLSKYLPPTDRLYSMNADELLAYAFPFLQTMFPAIRRDWIQAHHVWRARWAQPIVGQHYSRYIPATDGPMDGFHICTMAQVYPEDRGTNYAIREGRKLGARLAGLMSASTAQTKPIQDQSTAADVRARLTSDPA